MATIQGIYVALFGRPADPLGLQYFNSVTNNGANLSAIGSLSGSAEYQARFAGQSNVQVVNSIYQSLFGRPADAAGLSYFVAELQSGRQNINTIAINILDGAQGADRAVVDAKIAAANNFTSRLDTGPEIVAYSGDAAAAQGRAFLAPVNSTATIPNSAQTDAAITAIQATNAGGGTGQPGSTLTLTTSAAGAAGDTITGTAGNDTIRAVTAGSLQTVDNINGGAGNDVLNISAGAIGAGVTASPVITSVERINNNDGTNAVLDLSASTGVEQVWTGGAAGSYTGASLATVFGADNSVGANNTVAIDYAAALGGTNDVANLAVNNNTVAGSGTTFTSVDRANIEGLNIASLGTGAADLIDVNNFNAIKTITVTGSGDIVVDANGSGVGGGAVPAITTITTINASAATGNVTVFADGSTNAVNATGGSGNDTFVTGAANDILNGGAGADTYTGGLGADTYFIQTTTIGVNSSDTVNGFVSGTDKLEFNGPAGTAAPGSNFGTTTSANDFLSARSAAETFLATAANASVDYVAVNTGAGTYVFYDGNGDNALSTNGSDHSVFLTGVVNVVSTDII